ncbi:hypothetical protein CONPUDRAFT_75234 [Coniophora puteana RWD-64-598 SS2]|uniref:Uncharacterized protein n=1 Tax=Coniophora puteana (strain RWD-64-598) TaxID=741705 RepID=A0A5M3MHB5_CONPW|nr:uncharacterized protein CONPUDRAFT_75234 [Coniophora puteana RWD-64-598 SS2]EIW78602.1 hypothetical protein CONPUDRAFT_75234 [Coniophora puteana RWD-64-598 SS2]
MPSTNTRDQAPAVNFDAPVVSHDMQTTAPQPASYEWVQPYSSIVDLGPRESAPLQEPSGAPEHDVVGPSARLQIPRRQYEQEESDKEEGATASAPHQWAVVVVWIMRRVSAFTGWAHELYVSPSIRG